MQPLVQMLKIFRYSMVNVFVAIAIGQRILDSFRDDHVKILCRRVSELASSKSNIGHVYQLKKNQRYKFNFEKLSSMDRSVQGRHQTFLDLVGFFSFKAEELLVSSKIFVSDEENVGADDHNDELRAKRR